MSEYIPEFREPKAKPFLNFDLSIIDPEAIAQYIHDHHDMHILLSCGLENEPIQQSFLWSEPANSEIKLSAHIESKPLPPIEAEAWDETVRYTVARDISMLIPQLDQIDIPHDTSAVYFGRPGEYHAFSVRTVSDLDSCNIRIDTVPQDHIYTAASHDSDVLIDDYEGISAQTVIDCATIWAAVQDIIIDTYADMPKHATPENTIFVRAPFGAVDDFAQIEASVEHHQSEMTASPDDPFDKIGGLFEAKQKLMAYIDIFKDHEMAAEYAVHAPAFILYGPPGTGKTSLMEAFAEASGAKYRRITAGEIQDAYIGRTSGKLEEMFEGTFASTQPTVLCFDEIDRYLRKDIHSEFQAAAKTFGTLVERAKAHPHVLIAGATNTPPDQLINSIIRPGRFEIVNADAPHNNNERIDIWRAIIGKYALNNITNPETGEKIPLFAPSFSIEDIRDGNESADDVLRLTEYGEQTNGMTGADIQEITNIARLDKFRERRQSGVVRPISHQDILRAITNYRAVWRPTTDEA